MNKLWTDDGWADYLYWQSQDKKNFKKDQGVSENSPNDEFLTNFSKIKNNKH